VTVNRAGGALLSLDAHPLLREYFAKALRKKQPEAWKAAHKKLYQHLTTTTPDKIAATLDDLQPLYHAVAHGCFAGLQQDAREKVYQDRILRGANSAGFYSTNRLGAFGADLGAVACFFDLPWSHVSPNLTPSGRAWLLSVAAFILRALGRLTEALEPMRAGLEADIARKDWKNAAIAASNLSELELTLGEVEAAIRDAEAGVASADRSRNAFWRLYSRTTQAEALHEAGRTAEARELFAEAVKMQAKWQRNFPMLYSLQGFRHCDLLLADVERVAWRVIEGGAQLSTPRPLTEVCSAVAERARNTLLWVTPQNWHLDIGLDHLTLVRAALYAAILNGQPPGVDHLRRAVEFVRRSGNQLYLPSALLTLALFHAVTSDSWSACEDLDEAYEIAERGPMRLNLADIHLHRARLFGLMENRPSAYPWTSPRDDLDAAKKLIDECGYGRRREELADAEAAYKRINGGAG
jgi:tetratricopeptide (TPR) repeat protein